MTWDDARTAFAWAERPADARLAGTRRGALSRRRRLLERDQSGGRSAGRGHRQADRRAARVFIDYGFPATEYYHPQREQGTLMCHYRHRVHEDPFRGRA